MIVCTYCDVRTYGLYRIVREEVTNSFQTIMLADGLAWLWTNENDRLIWLDGTCVTYCDGLFVCLKNEERTTATVPIDTIRFGLAWLGLAWPKVCMYARPWASIKTKPNFTLRFPAVAVAVAALQTFAPHFVCSDTDMIHPEQGQGHWPVACYTWVDGGSCCSKQGDSVLDESIFNEYHHEEEEDDIQRICREAPLLPWHVMSCRMSMEQYHRASIWFLRKVIYIQKRRMEMWWTIVCFKFERVRERRAWNHEQGNEWQNWPSCDSFIPVALVHSRVSCRKQYDASIEWRKESLWEY